MQVAHGPFDVSQLLQIVDCVSGLMSSGIIIEELDMFEHFGGQRNGIHGFELFKTGGAIKEERVLVRVGNILLKRNAPHICGGVMPAL